eukprot:Gb_24184 [translate_table: standard]
MPHKCAIFSDAQLNIERGQQGTRVSSVIPYTIICDAFVKAVEQTRKEATIFHPKRNPTYIIQRKCTEVKQLTSPLLTDCVLPKPGTSTDYGSLLHSLQMSAYLHNEVLMVGISLALPSSPHRPSRNCALIPC